MKTVLSLIFSFVAIIATAGDMISWSRGTVVEKDGQVKIGDISFHSVDLILFKSDDKITVYTPYHIKSFFYFDKESNINRKFNVLQTSSSETPLFYEYVVWGKVQMIRVAKSKNLIKGKLRDAFDYKYYICWQGQYSRVKNFKRDVYPMLVENTPILDQMVHREKLNSNYLNDVADILRLYNKVISAPAEIIARN